MNDVDIFAGPGGWEVAARALGADPIGIEWNAAACETRRAAGLRTVQADVTLLDPVDFAPCRRLVASPPCPAWSGGGKTRGADADLCVDAALALVDGQDRRAELGARCVDDRSMAIIEPLRWARDLRPHAIALEQVPPVLRFWRFVAAQLARLGYETWTGVLNAADFGVPQIRRRAILLARLGEHPQPPPATHSEHGPRPWRTMASAIGWGRLHAPALTVTASVSRDGACNPLDGGTYSRHTYYRDRAARRWRDKLNADFRTTNWEAMRPSIAEAGILQGFPPGFPWRGTVAEQAEQVGNAIPPPLAAAIFASLTPG